MKKNKVKITNLDIGEIKETITYKKLFFQFNDSEPEEFLNGLFEKFQITLKKDGDEFQIESKDGNKFKLFLK